MKQVKFHERLVPLIVSGEKTATWRLFDDKNLSVNDEIELLESGKTRPFATARITKVIEKPFVRLTAADKVGHETFKSDEDMYATFGEYYKTEVTGDTIIKVNWFQLLNSK